MLTQVNARISDWSVLWRMGLEIRRSMLSQRYDSVAGLKRPNRI